MNLLVAFQNKNNSKGFTLIEILVVLGLVAIIGSIGLIFGMENFRGGNFHSNRDVLVSALQHARAQAVSNICRGGECEDGVPHGVFIDTENNLFVIFQGERYNADDEQNVYLDASENMVYGGIEEVVFAQLSGDVLFAGLEDEDDLSPEPWEISIQDQGSFRESIISINAEGQILWTN